MMKPDKKKIMKKAVKKSMGKKGDSKMPAFMKKSANPFPPKPMMPETY